MYCHISKIVKSRTVLKIYEGGTFSVAEHEVAVEIVERVMQTAYMKCTYPRPRTRGLRERPWELVMP